MSHDPVSGRASSKTSPDSKAGSDLIGGTRELPPIPTSEPSGSVQDVPPRPSSVHTVSLRPTPPPSSTPPEQRAARPIGVENLLNPPASGTSAAGSHRQHSDRADSPRFAPTSGWSRPQSPSFPPASTRKSSAGEMSLPSITPPLMNAYPPQPRAGTPRSPTTYGPTPVTSGLPTGNIDVKQSPFLLTREQGSLHALQGPPGPAAMGLAPASMPHQYPSAAAAAHPSPRVRQLSQSGPSPRSQEPKPFQGATGAAHVQGSRSSSPSSVTHRPSPPATSNQTGHPQSFFTGPISANPSVHTANPGPFDRKTSMGANAPGQGQYPMMTLETETGTIQVPVDVQLASRVADEKRKRNATASHRFRQRRKEKEQETAQNISSLETQVRELTEERDFYQRERDVFQDVVLRNRLPMAPRPLSPRRRRHASLGGAPMPSYQDTETAAREDGRNMRRRTSAYVPPQGPPPPSVDPPPPMPPFERIGRHPTENIQDAQHRMRPQGPPYQPSHHPYGANPPQ